MKTVFLLGKIKLGCEDASLQQLKQLESVAEARLVFGKYDFYAKLNVENHKLGDVLDKIKSMMTIEGLHVMLPREEGLGE